jgi:hypothetical protein
MIKSRESLQTCVLAFCFLMIFLNLISVARDIAIILL